MVSSIHVLSKTTTLFHAGWKVDKKAKAQPGTCGKGGQFDAWMEGIITKREETMKAYCMNGSVIDVVKADKYVKQVDENAAYMADVGTYMLMLIPSDKTEIESGHEYMTYKINDEMYESCLTSKHDELVKFYGGQTFRKNRALQEQLSLF